MFDLTVISPKRVVFEKAVERLWIDGDDSEYEFLSFHANALGVLRRGHMVVNNDFAIPYRKGIVHFQNNKCVVLVEEETDDDMKTVPDKR